MKVGKKNKTPVVLEADSSGNTNWKMIFLQNGKGNGKWKWKKWKRGNEMDNGNEKMDMEMDNGNEKWKWKRGNGMDKGNE